MQFISFGVDIYYSNSFSGSIFILFYCYFIKNAYHFNTVSCLLNMVSDLLYPIVPNIIFNRLYTYCLLQKYIRYSLHLQIMN